jgi:hypothetical protein
MLLPIAFQRAGVCISTGLPCMYIYIYTYMYIHIVYSAVLECCCIYCAVSKTVLADIFSLLGCYAAQVDSFQSFGTTCPSHIYKSGVVGFKVGPISCYETSATSNLRCLTFQKSEDLIYAATEV